MLLVRAVGQWSRFVQTVRATAITMPRPKRKAEAAVKSESGTAVDENGYGKNQ